jgi:hypothetical protein
MGKHIIIGRSRTGGRPAMAEVAAAFGEFLETRPWIERCAVHVAGAIGDPPAPGEPDMAVELWTSREPLDWASEIAAAPLDAGAGYHLHEIIEKGDGVFPKGTLSGLTLVVFVRPRPGVEIGEVKARWDRHAPLARRVHVGMQRYSRNLIEWISTPGARPYIGVAVLQFATDADFLEGLWESPEGRAAIEYDVAAIWSPNDQLSLTARTEVLR